MTCGECGNVTAPGTGFPNHVYCKRFLLHMEKRKDASRCRDFIPKPVTNADRIRAMSDEEMAIWIFTHRWNDCSSLLDWLKQEVEKAPKKEEQVKPATVTRHKKSKDDDISTYQEYSYMRHPDRVEMGTY